MAQALDLVLATPPSHHFASPAEYREKLAAVQSTLHSSHEFTSAQRNALSASAADFLNPDPRHGLPMGEALADLRLLVRMLRHPNVATPPEERFRREYAEEVFLASLAKVAPASSSSFLPTSGFMPTILPPPPRLVSHHHPPPAPPPPAHHHAHSPTTTKKEKDCCDNCKHGEKCCDEEDADAMRPRHPMLNPMDAPPGVNIQYARRFQSVRIPKPPPRSIEQDVVAESAAGPIRRVRFSARKQVRQFPVQQKMRPSKKK